MITRIEVGNRPGMPDSRGISVADRVRNHLGIPVELCRTRDVYLIDAEISKAEAERIADEFAGVVVRQGAVGRLEDGPFDVAVSVSLKPGVTDPVGKSARVAVGDLLGRDLGAKAAVYASRLYLFDGITREQGERIGRDLIANEVIEDIEVMTFEQWEASPVAVDPPKVLETPMPAVERVDLEIDDHGLEELSRRRLLALTLEEMRTLRDFYRGLAKDSARKAVGLDARPTDVELECLAQTWSEHCKHKIMSAEITYRENGGREEVIPSLFARYIKGTTEAIAADLEDREGGSWLVSVFHDNAGVVRATDDYHLVYKVETHNSPSALDPYGGAITGIVGVNRDPFGTGLGAELLSNVWGYCLASPRMEGEVPAGLLHPRRIREGVHLGVIDGGNQSGIPYARGFEVFDDRFLGKPLVYCGTVARMPVRSAGRATHEKAARPGDRVVMVGGRIGKDGIHGATFSSAELTEESPVQAVQIGDPITQKMMFDFLLEVRDLGIYTAITDNGAGGLSSSVGEMAEASGGARLDLALAPLKYRGLAAWEILVSEAQERMTVAVPPEHLERFLSLARRREVEATDLGEFTDDGIFHVTYGNETVAWLPMTFLHEGLPKMRLSAHWSPVAAGEPDRSEPPGPTEGNALAAEMLSRLNLRSNETMARRYDHEVKGLTIIKPWVGVDCDVPSDASVFQIAHDDETGYALAEGIFPTYSDIDAHAMAQAGVDLSVRRVIAAGALPSRIAALDNYCWPDPLAGPTNPDAEHKLAQLVRASKGLSEACIAYSVPLISGKDSMKNDAVVAGRRISIPPTLLVSAIGIVPDVHRAMSLEPSSESQSVLVVGETRQEVGATEWAVMQGFLGSSVPRCDPMAWARRYAAVAEVIHGGFVTAVSVPARGGLLPAIFRMALAGGIGMQCALDSLPVGGDPSWEARLFGESCGRFVLTCSREDCARILDALQGEPVAVIGETTASGRLSFSYGGAAIVDADLSALASAWKGGK